MGFEDFLKEILGGVGQSMETDMRVPGPKPVPEPTEEGGVSGVMRRRPGCRVASGLFGGMSSAWTGSGTLVDPSGIILTNCHVASPRRHGDVRPAGRPARHRHHRSFG